MSIRAYPHYIHRVRRHFNLRSRPIDISPFLDAVTQIVTLRLKEEAGEICRETTNLSATIYLTSHVARYFYWQTWEWEAKTLSYLSTQREIEQVNV